MHYFWEARGRGLIPKAATAYAFEIYTAHKIHLKLTSRQIGTEFVYLYNIHNVFLYNNLFPHQFPFFPVISCHQRSTHTHTTLPKYLRASVHVQIYQPYFLHTEHTKHFFYILFAVRKSLITTPQTHICVSALYTSLYYLFFTVCLKKITLKFTLLYLC